MTCDSPDISVYRRYIEEALAFSGGTHHYEDVERLVAEGQLQFWPGPDSVVITEIQEHPRGRVLHFFLAGGGPGSLAEMERAAPLILDWGRAQGCTAATLTGRKGWERTFLSRTGWSPTLQVFRRSLDGS